METTVVADQVIVNNERQTILSPGAVTVADGRIVAVEPITGSRPRGAAVVDLGESVILPGLVNAHAHTPMSLMQGVAEGHSLLTLQGWLGAIRSLEEFLTPELVGASVAVSCAEMIATGTTFFADQYFYAETYIPVIRSSGLRAKVAYGIVELGDDAARASALASAQAFIAGSQDDSIVDGWIGPHAFFVDNTVEAIDREMSMAREYGAGLHTHFATSGEEDEACLAAFGMSALAKMSELGLLELPLLLAHCNDIARDELPLLAGTRATMVAVPSVAMASGAGAPPVREALNYGVNVALGTDNVCNNNGYDMFEEMRTLGKLAAFSERWPNIITPPELLGMATWRGHRALAGGADDGRLVPGAVADLIALPLGALHRGPIGAQSLISAVVYGVAGSDVTHTMTAGEWLKFDSTLQTVDLASARAQRQVDFDTLMARVARR